MAQLAFELLFRFLWGSFLVLFFVRREETSERFFRIAYWISVGVSLFAIFLFFLGQNSWKSPEVYSLAAMLVGQAFFVFSESSALRVIGLLLHVLSCAGILAERGWEGAFNFVSASILLGGVYAAQFLGHWFLTVPGLHIGELKRVVKLFFVGLGLKSLELIWALWSRWGAESRLFVDDMGRSQRWQLGTNDLSFLDSAQSLFGVQGEMSFGLGTFGLLLLATRILWGIFAPYILGYMIYKTVLMRSTQSATGILYALCVMLLVGEGAALFLLKTLGWNI